MQMPMNKESIFPEFRTFRTLIQMHLITPFNINQLTILGTPSNTLSNPADQL